MMNLVCANNPIGRQPINLKINIFNEMGMSVFCYTIFLPFARSRTTSHPQFFNWVICAEPKKKKKPSKYRKLEAKIDCLAELSAHIPYTTTTTTKKRLVLLDQGLNRTETK